MKKFLSIVLLVLCLCPLVMADVYFNDWYKTNLDYSDDWAPVQPEEDEKQVLLKLKNKELDALITLSAYTYAEAVTVNAFKDRRIASGYDGWRHIAEREAFDHELTRANAHEGYFAIYSKTQMDSRLREANIVVAEYYFIVDKKGYVFSLSTPRKGFQGVQSAYKKVLESFWIGDGDKPMVQNRGISVMDWEMIGKNAANHNNMISRFDPSTDYKVVWSKEVESLKRRHYKLFSRGFMISANGNVLTCVSVHDGAEKWSYELKEPVRHQMMVYDKTLYVQIEGPDEQQLLLIDFEKGRLVRRIDLSSDRASHPVVSGNYLYMIEGDYLYVRNVSSGDILWKTSDKVSNKYYPVVASNTVLLVSRDHDTVLAYNQSNGQPKWSVELDTAPVFSPIVSNGVAFFVREGLTPSTDNHLGVSAHDLQSGNMVWSYQSEIKTTYLNYQPVLSGHQLFIYTKLDGQFLVQAMDVNTGTISWTLPYMYETKPVISDNYTYILKDVPQDTEREESEKESNEVASRFQLSVFDNKSGQESFQVKLRDSLFGDIHYPQMIETYKQYVMLYYEDASQWFSLKAAN